ncbi:MAG: AAA family ATPase [Spirochaetota bacterium]
MEKAIENLQNSHQIIGRKNELRSCLIAATAGKHILLEGPVGVGKTTIAIAVCSHLERKVFRIDGDERYTEQKLAGWFDPPLVMAKGYTNESFMYGPLALAMKEGALLLVNELNRMPEGTQNVLLSAMDEKTIFIPKFGTIKAQEGFLITATQNPDEYIGTSQLSEALRDRFVCIDLDYQTEPEEKQIVRLRSQCSDRAIINTSVQFARLTRQHRDIRRGSSVRGAIDLADLYYQAYGSFHDDLDGWVSCARLAFSTKIELNDFSKQKFLEVLEELAGKAIDWTKNHNSGEADQYDQNDDNSSEIDNNRPSQHVRVNTPSIKKN